MPGEESMDSGMDYRRVLHFKGSTLIEDPLELQQFIKVVDDFLMNEDVAALVKGIEKSINGQHARLQFYDDVRRLVPPRLQMEYNLLAPYTSSRVRNVRLLRGLGSPVTGSAIFGFSIRGGREHGTGFFVSEVGVEARAAGLRVGDQILRINGYSVEHAIHQEVLKLIQDSNHLNLKVRSVGMIPVKENDDGLETASEDDNNSALSSPGILPSEPLSPTKPKPQLIRKNTPPALTLTEMATLKKIAGQQENGDNRIHFQPQLETIPAGSESPPPVTSDRRTDPLIWVPVGAEGDAVQPQSPSTTPIMDSLEQPELIQSNGRMDGHQDVKQFLSIAGRSKLDCSICKGPECQPGIFIQSTKEGGLAREAGLRPGDQIIECNGISFEDIAFSDAVNVLKKDKNLNLVIRKGSGTDLFPGESSGYNSSASSINGDGSSSGHSPNGVCQIWNDEAKRLSIVREEVSDMVGNTKIQSSEGRVVVDKSKDWDEIEYEWEIADKQQSLMNNEDKGHRVSIINHIRDSEQGNEEDSIEEVMVQTQEVVAMVHRSEVDVTDGSSWNKIEAVTLENQSHIPEAPSISTENHITLSKTNSSSSAVSEATTISLSSALSLEIQKRAQRFGLIDNDCIDEMTKKKNQTKEDINGFRKDLLKEIGEDKKMQHSKLMEEFKKAHSKMFANSLTFEEDETHSAKPEEDVMQRNLEDDSAERTRNNKQKDIEEKREEEAGEEPAVGDELSKSENKNEGEIATPPPPPPPPPPLASSSNHVVSNGLPQREKEAPVPSPPSVIKKQTSYVRTPSNESPSPRSPQTSFFSSENNIQIIQSEKKTEVIPKKPQQHPKSHVSVIISEYPSSNATRNEPTKMPIFDKNKPAWRKFVEPSSETKANSVTPKDWNHVASQVQSELRQTLSRTKLKEQTEAPLEDKKQSSKIFLAGTNGNDAKGNETAEGKQNSVVSRYLSQMYGPEKSTAETSQPRSPSSATFHNTDKILNALANKVTIRIPNSASNSK